MPLADDEKSVYFPDIACDDDRLMVVYRSAPSHSSGGRIHLRRATIGGDGTLDWGEPDRLGFVWGGDQRDPSITRLPDGRWVVSRTEFSAQWVTKLALQESRPTVAIGLDPTTPPIPIFPQHFPTVGASWNGSTWIDSKGSTVESWSSTSKALMVGGELALPIYGGAALEPSSPRSRRRLALARPGAPGEPWTRTVILEGAYPDRHLSEPSIVRLRDGRLLLAARSSLDENNPGGQGPVIEAWSSDEGVTWTDVRDWGDHDWYGQAPALHVTRTGTVLLGTRDVDWLLTKFRVAIRASTDGGSSWSAPLVASTCTMVDCGYPSFTTCGGHDWMGYYLAQGAGIEVVRLGISR